MGFRFKKTVLIGALAISTFLSAATEGTEYIKLTKAQQIPNADDKIIELLSYGCIHCYNHFKNGTLKFVSEFFPEFKYEEWQVKQMGEYGYQMAEVLAYAKMLDGKSGINSLSVKSSFHQILKAYFEANFKQRKRYNDANAFYQVAIDVLKNQLNKDVSVQDIIDYAKSDAGKKQIQRFDDGFEVAKLNGTPAFIIKGKYLINLEKIGSAEELVEVISEIVKLD